MRVAVQCYEHYDTPQSTDTADWVKEMVWDELRATLGRVDYVEQVRDWQYEDVAQDDAVVLDYRDRQKANPIPINDDDEYGEYDEDD